ncbi:MAG: zinc ribbon domain-containing protein [SAR202 cluster bacterium]|nr:zinc ribbon domain-containing protein [SAR202 cluster bacterium]
MPIYEYGCTRCNTQFEKRRPIRSADDPANCPECGGNGQRLLSVFASTNDTRLKGPDRGAFRADTASFPDFEAIQSQHDQLQRDVLDLTRQRDGLESDIASARQSIESLSEESDRLGNSIEDLLSTQSMLKDNEDTTRTHIRELETRRELLESAIVALNVQHGEAASVREEDQRLAEQLEVTRAEIEGLQGELAQLEVQRRETDREIQQHSTRRAALSAGVREVEVQRDTLTTNVEQLRHQLELASLEIEHKEASQQALTVELARLEAQRVDLDSGVEQLQGQSAELGGTIQALESQRQELSDSMDEMEGQRGALETNVAGLQGQDDELAQAQAQKSELLAQIESLKPQRDGLKAEIEQGQEENQNLQQRIQELDERLFGWDGINGQLAEIGFASEQLPVLVERGRELAVQSDIQPAEVGQRILNALQGIDSLESSLVPQRAEATENQQRIAEQKEEEQRLNERLDSLRQEEHALQQAIAGAQTQLERAGDEAASTVREGAQTLRRELDSLFRETTELAGRAAQVDADIRSQEWLSRLLALVEGQGGIDQQEVRALGLILMQAFLGWFEGHEELVPGDAKGDLERLVSALHDWRDQG